MAKAAYPTIGIAAFVMFGTVYFIGCLQLKNIAQIEHSRHRSFNNFIANALSAIAAYCFFEKKPAIEVEFVNDGQLTLF